MIWIAVNLLSLSSLSGAQYINSIFNNKPYATTEITVQEHLGLVMIRPTELRFQLTVHRPHMGLKLPHEFFIIQNNFHYR